MQIDSIGLFHVALPLRGPVETAGRRLDTLETVLLRMRSGDTAGWGEASPGNAPLAGAEWAAGVFACLRDWLAPALKGQWIESGDQLAERLAPFRGNRFAKAALDTAWWDLSARKQGRPLHETLGGERTDLEVGLTFDQMQSLDDLLAAVGEGFESGYARVRLMMRPDWNVSIVDWVRKEFPTERLHVDFEAALGLGHLEMLHRLDDFFLEMIEQPLGADDFVGHRGLQAAVRTPVCLHEGITTVEQADIALDLESCKYVNLEPGRVGGLTPALAIHDACQENSVACFAGAMPQSAIGGRIGLALAAKPNCTYPADFFPSDQLLEQDLAEPLLPARDQTDGKMRVRLWSEPGLGVEPQPELLERFCIAQAKP